MDLLVKRSDGIEILRAKDLHEKAAIESLQWFVRDRVLNILLELRREGFDPCCNEGLRSLERQKQLVAGGTSWTLNSLHLKGKAADIVDAKLLWGASKAFWSAVGSAARHQGMLWGGTWKGKKRDVAHVEWRGGRIA